jgi:transcriptional regulator with XRE-family HTH domain
MDKTHSPGTRLAAWRAARDPKVTLQSCADGVGVKHPTWLDWEKGNRSPSLQKALALELFTDGEIEIEAWGFDAATLASMRGVVRHRDAAARRARRDAVAVIDPALDDSRPSMVA